MFKNSAVASLVWAATLWAQASGDVVVTTDSQSQDTSYTAANGSCRISWVVSGLAINRGGARLRFQCSLPIAEQVPLISKVMDKALAGADLPHTLYWGRLYPDGRPDPTLAMRLAIAAKRSPLWDAPKGRPRSGNVNELVRKLANEALIYRELRDMFQAKGLDIHVTSVEKVLVAPAARLPFFEQLPAGEIRATDKLPFDCMTWFSITRLSR